MKFFSHELAIDLGTANTVIFYKGQIALDEPLKAVARGTCIAIEDTEKYKYKFLMR